MPYLDETGLAYYNEKIQQWIAAQPVKTLPSTLYPWTLTDKAGAVTCWPAGGTPLLPIVDFLFTETPPASGDKSPSNPSTISGVSEVKVTRCGENLLRYNYNSNTVQPGSSVTTSGVTVSNDHGAYSISGSNTSGGTVGFDIVTKGSQELVLPSGDYVFSANFPSGFLADARIQIVGYQNEDIVVNTYSKDTSRTFTVPNGEPVVFRLYIRIGTGAVIPSGCIASPQIELDSTATSFEPYAGTDYTLPLGSTYYGGSIDLATGVMTVTWEAFSLNGTENWTFGGETATTGVYVYSLKHGFVADGGSTGNGGVCSHFVYDDGAGATQIVSWHHSKNYLYIYSDISDLDDFKTWLSSQTSADTPVTICDKKVTPFESPLAPTQILSLTQPDKYTPRVNTIYTDASAVQVGYVKSPIREEIELQQAIVGLGGNI